MKSIRKERKYLHANLILSSSLIREFEHARRISTRGGNSSSRNDEKEKSRRLEAIVLEISVPAEGECMS